MKLILRAKFQFMLALLVAAIFGWRDPKQAVKRFGKAFGLWLGLVGRKEKSVLASLYFMRLDACEHCPIYYKPLGTCSSPLSESSVGCWCYMPAKAQLMSAQCWMDEHLDEPSEHSWRNQGLPDTHLET